jgi:hypothetical protein
MATNKILDMESIRKSYVPIVDTNKYPEELTMVLVSLYVSPRDIKAVKEDVAKKYKTKNVLFCESRD